MQTFRAVVRRNPNGSLVGYFPAFPGTEATGASFEEVREALHGLALTLMPGDGGRPSTAEIGIETVSVL